MSTVARNALGLLAVCLQCCIDKPVFVDRASLVGQYEGNRKEIDDRLELGEDGTYRYETMRDGIKKTRTGRWAVQVLESGTRVEILGACFEWSSWIHTDCDANRANVSHVMPAKIFRNNVFLLVEADENLHFKKIHNQSARQPSTL